MIIQELLNKGLSFFTIKVYLAAITKACQIGFGGMTPGAHPFAMCFSKGVCRLRPEDKSSIPPGIWLCCWRCFVGPHFSALSLQVWIFLSYKIALLLFLSLRRVGDLHALPVHPSCTQFTLDGSKITLRPGVFVFSQQPTALWLLTSWTFDRPSRGGCLCSVCVCTYIDCTQSVHLCDQLCVFC